MVEFLKEVKQNDGDFTFEKGGRYASKDNPADTDKVLIRQPNSPKKCPWWSSFPKSKEGELFRTLDRTEMTVQEIIEENKSM